MKASLFVYTRTFYTDFHVLYNPKGYEENLMDYTELAEKLVAQYDVNKETQPHWVYLKFDNSILWGVVCANSCLGKKFTDKASRLVRGFFGIVVSIEERTHLLLPYDLAFFADLYQQNVDQVWEIRSYNSLEYEFEFDSLSNNRSFDVKEIDSLRTLKNYVVMSNIDEYCEFLDKRNDEKRKKRELKMERLSQEEERRRELERSAMASHVDETPSYHGNQAEENGFFEELCIGAAFLVVGLACLWMLGGFDSPKQKPAPLMGNVYCVSCEGTGYKYKYLWGVFSSKCSTCRGSGYVPNIAPFIPGRKDPTTFQHSESNEYIDPIFKHSEYEKFKGNKCDVIKDGKFCNCSGCEPSNWNPFICSNCKDKCKDHNRK